MTDQAPECKVCKSIRAIYAIAGKINRLLLDISTSGEISSHTNELRALASKLNNLGRYTQDLSNRDWDQYISNLD